jgi:hypothetical protein
VTSHRVRALASYSRILGLKAEALAVLAGWAFSRSLDAREDAEMVGWRADAVAAEETS